MPSTTDTPAGTSTSTPVVTAPGAQLTGPANADSNVSPTTTTAGTATNPATVTSGGSTNVSPVASSTNGTDITTLAPVTIVGKRPRNPLSNFSSSTYHITLYMVSPDAYNDFVQSGRKNINAKTPGAYIVAQSGGTPNTDISKRASGFELDFFIDNLRIDTVLPAASPTTTAMSFSITEPYGFSFITNLNKALNTIRSVSSIPGYSTSTATFNPTRQFFILSVGFRGYDLNGKVMTNSDINKQNVLNTDISGSGQVFDHFYEIIITSMKFKLDGKETKYDIKAATMAPTMSFGTKLGTVPDVTIVARTLAEALGGAGKDPVGVTGLLSFMNDQQDKLVHPLPDPKNASAESSKPRQAYANVYKVEWKGADVDVSALKNATMASPADTDKAKQAGMPIKNSNQATVKAEKAAHNPLLRNIPMKAGVSIIAAINTLIKQSTWIEDRLKVIQASKPEYDTDTENADTDPGKDELKWYNLSSSVKIIGWNDQQNDFAYEITYIIQPYSTPAVGTSFVKAQSKYYGADKRYDYWLTGKNSEIIKIEQQFDNAYLNTMYMGTGSNDGSSIPNSPNMLTNVEQQQRQGEGTTSQNATEIQLRDPAAYTKTKLQILGDPDYLMPDTAQEPGFYTEDSYTINPSSRQVFIEVSYKEAQDYQNSTGHLLINGNIQFFPYSAAVQAKLKGAMSYLLISVTSSFSKGAFIQDLTTAVNTFPNYVEPTTAASSTNTASGRGASSEGNAGEAAAQANMAGNLTNSVVPLSVTNAVTNVTNTATTAVNNTVSTATNAVNNAGTAVNTVVAAANQTANDDASLSQTDKASGV